MTEAFLTLQLRMYQIKCWNPMRDGTLSCISYINTQDTKKKQLNIWKQTFVNKIFRMMMKYQRQMQKMLPSYNKQFPIKMTCEMLSHKMNAEIRLIPFHFIHFFFLSFCFFSFILFSGKLKSCTATVWLQKHWLQRIFRLFSFQKALHACLILIVYYDVAAVAFCKEWRRECIVSTIQHSVMSIHWFCLSKQMNE